MMPADGMFLPPTHPNINGNPLKFWMDSFDARCESNLRKSSRLCFVN